jgi:hypothetical protein
LFYVAQFMLWRPLQCKRFVTGTCMGNSGQRPLVTSYDSMLGELLFECVVCIAEALLEGLLEGVREAFSRGSSQDRSAG